MEPIMKTDTAVLAQGADQFATVSAGLTTEITKVQAIAGQLQADWIANSSTAAQQAFVRFQDAAAAQTRALDEISDNIRDSGIGYTGTDDDQMSVINSAMSIDIT